ncbi:hypothetical protein NUSPORA_01998 [Nucleospora cyclopteri]
MVSKNSFRTEKYIHYFNAIVHSNKYYLYGNLIFFISYIILKPPIPFSDMQLTIKFL